MKGVCVCIERVCRLCEAAAGARGDDVYSFRTLRVVTPQNHMLGALQHILCPMTIPGKCIQIQSGAAITTLIGLVRPVPCAESYVHIQNSACNTELSWPGAHLVHIHGNQIWADPHLRGDAYKHTYYSNFGREICHIPTNRSLRRQPRAPSQATSQAFLTQCWGALKRFSPRRQVCRTLPLPTQWTGERLSRGLTSAFETDGTKSRSKCVYQTVIL